MRIEKKGRGAQNEELDRRDAQTADPHANAHRRSNRCLRTTNDAARNVGGVKPPELKLQSPQIAAARRNAAKSKRRPGIKTRLVLGEPRGEEDEADPRNRNVIKVKR